jgi:hypothetical protein
LNFNNFNWAEAWAKEYKMPAQQQALTLYVIMKISIAIIIFMTVTSFGINHSQDDFKFGIKYNSVRLKFGVPVINKNMVKQEGYGSWVVYNINKEPIDKPYHYSKAIVAFDNNKVYQEKDTYRQNFDDTTIRELDMDVFYDWEHNTVVIQGSVGKLDKRKFAIKAEDYLKQIPPKKLPSYKWETLDLNQIDSLLNSWKLSRFDKD